jgi:hypothetical protein
VTRIGELGKTLTVLLSISSQRDSVASCC